MNSPAKKSAGYTSVKYFISYLLIISALIIGFFFIIKDQFTKSYLDHRKEQVSNQLSHFAETLQADLNYLSQVDMALAEDMELLESRYSTTGVSSYAAHQELREYASTTKLIRSIVYYSKRTDTLLSTQVPVTYEDGIFTIVDPYPNMAVFDPAPYYNVSSGQLIYLCGDKTEYLLYFPPTKEHSNYVFFYFLDAADLQQQFKGMITDETVSVALVDKNRNPAIVINENTFSAYQDDIILEKGTYQLDASTYLCVQPGISGSFSLIAIMSHDQLTSHLNEAFAVSYPPLIGLSIVGFLLILLAMRITYTPLYKLTQKVIPNPDPRQGYLTQLESAFSETRVQNALLQDTLENYRSSVQKALLDSVATSQQPRIFSSLSDLDQLFDQSPGRKLFVIRVKNPEGTLPWEPLRTQFQEALPDDGSCFLIETTENTAIFLINYTGDDENKDEGLKKLCTRLYEALGYFSAISSGSEFALDIPALCENAHHAEKYWPAHPVIEFNSLSHGSASFSYPHDILSQLSQRLTENSYEEVRTVIESLFSVMNRYILEPDHLTTFFVQCILIDMLTIIVNHMNLSYIRFHDYSDLYFETLYFCRSCSYTEKAKEIEANMLKLVTFCKQAIIERSFSTAPLLEFVEERYCQPDFSIAVLADKYHVSIAYMSQLFKKETNANFSDYLWTLRQKKAQSLLRNTDLSIDEISMAVGYTNASSFRRKFKQETGLTPSQFRESSKTTS